MFSPGLLLLRRQWVSTLFMKDKRLYVKLRKPFQTKIVDSIKIHIFLSNHFFFSVRMMVFEIFNDKEENYITSPCKK